MCGIAAVILAQCLPDLPPDWPSSLPPFPDHAETHVPTPSIQQFLPALRRRGPDAQQLRSVVLPHATIHTAYTILSLRGSRLSSASSSLHDPHCDHSFLLFNGEIYDDDTLPENHCDADEESDTGRVHKLLDDVLNRNGDPLKALDGLRGPWALIFWHARSKRLYFGRDQLGRRSLVVQFHPPHFLAISSVPPETTCANNNRSSLFEELPPNALYVVDFSACASPEQHAPTFHQHKRSHTFLNRTVNAKRIDDDADDAGNDCSSSSSSSSSSFLPRSWLRSLRRNVDVVQPPRACLQTTAERLVTLLSQSVVRRLVCNEGMVVGDGMMMRYSVLFSGGLDSMIVARLVDMNVRTDERIGLSTAAFGDNESELRACGDRASAISGAAELQRLSRRRERFVHTMSDTTGAEALERLERAVKPCLGMRAEKMDRSIGTALSVATAGCGTRVVLSGLGADELMGGYQRHRTRFREGGWGLAGLEMDVDLSRMWKRNLGRDDRVVGFEGKEVRFPFLDEDVVELLTGWAVEQVCDLERRDGQGDKRVLRNAGVLLGLSEESVGRRKRAMQFGSRCKQTIEGRGGEGR